MAFRSAILFTISLGLFLTGCPGDPQVQPPTDKDPNGLDRELGASNFLSADYSDNTRGGDAFEDVGNSAEPAAESDDDRTVEEGDIYRVIRDGLLANLNSYRGLQLIDISNPDEPSILGRLQISGYPVEMYVRGDHAYVLMNNWYGYYGRIGETDSSEAYEGGIIAKIDISDPANPVLKDREFIPGNIMKSRLVSGSQSAALYVAASVWNYTETSTNAYSYSTTTVVKSLDLSGELMEEKSELDLGGYVSDIQATPQALLVARFNYDEAVANEEGSRVAVIDISDPAGAMELGDEVVAAGFVESQFNMDLHEGVLRIASGNNWWANTGTNHIQTFDATNLNELSEIDHATYGDGESLFATIFLGNKAFVVTYEQVDPFHAFEITPEGFVTEKSEFIVSGWNEFFRAVQAEERLIGIGFNDEEGRTLSVSLYDITDLENAEPLLARADVDADYSWSEAAWDHRAFSVIENATSVQSESGATETGLVLLPFSGWDEERYSAAVQIFTFSDSTLTRRGLMEHGTPVRRSFAAAEDLTANLSEAQLSLFDTADVDAPAEQGRLELAPNYTDVLFFQDHPVRLSNTSSYYYNWWYDQETLPTSQIEILAVDADPDTAQAIATIEVPAYATHYQVGDLLIVIDTKYLGYEEEEYLYESTLRVFDLSDPTVPVKTAEFTTDRLAPSYSYYGYYDIAMGDCFDCGYYGGGQLEAMATKDGLAFLQRVPHYEVTDVQTICYDVDGIAGGEEECYDQENWRYWQTLTIEVLDLSDALEPTFIQSINLPDENQGVGFVKEGNTMWLNYLRTVNLTASQFSYVRYFARSLDLANLNTPRLGEEINIPGSLLAVDGDKAFTRDYLWNADGRVEESVNRVRLDNDLAYLEAFHRFEDRYVYQVALDGDDNLLVTHQKHWELITNYDTESITKLTVLDAFGNMNALSAIDVGYWGSLQQGVQGKALFLSYGGILVVNLDDPTEPYAQAYFPVRGWPSRLQLHDDEVVVPAGRYGIYSFDLDTFNLLQEQF